ncbi:MAG TPA: glycosyltransferase family 4 protein [Candidatus Limnocylindrales bacterium]|nr:glycosyltransferase family 4 protein [Candidatus Limnocylindrales bacterium]
MRRRRSTLVFATPGGDENHPWAHALRTALEEQTEVEHCPAELSEEQRQEAIETVPPALPLMRRIMAERSPAATAMRARSVEQRLRDRPPPWLALQLYTNDVLPPFRLDAVYTDIFLGQVAERTDLPGTDWDPEALTDALRREREMLHRCRRVYVTSHWVADYGRRRLGLGNRLVVAGVGPVIEAPEPPPPRDPGRPPRIVFIGNDAERKGLGILLEAYAGIRAERPEVELAVIGRASLESLLPVTWHGHIDARNAGGRARLGGILSEADLFVLPTRFDPVGIAFLDAMSHGLPIVGPRDCMVPEYLEEGVTGRFCRLAADDIARVALECLGDPAACAEMGRRARQVQQSDYRWPRVVRTILDDWRRVRAEELAS